MLTEDTLSRLLTFRTFSSAGTQAFFTKEALESIARTTLANITAFERGDGTVHRVTADF